MIAPFVFIGGPNDGQTINVETSDAGTPPATVRVYHANKLRPRYDAEPIPEKTERFPETTYDAHEFFEHPDRPPLFAYFHETLRAQSPFVVMLEKCATVGRIENRVRDLLRFHAELRALLNTTAALLDLRTRERDAAHEELNHLKYTHNP